MTLSSDGSEAYVADKESCDVREINTSSFITTRVMKLDSKYGCPYGIAATSVRGIVVTVTGSDHTLGLGGQGDAMENLNLNDSTVSVVHGVGPDPVTVSYSAGFAYAV
jgi:hypothetical protein